MQGSVEKITAQYESQMQQLFADHDKQMAVAQRAFTDAVEKAGHDFQAIIDRHQKPVEEKSPDRPKQKPEAVWTKIQDDDVLVLNWEAAIMQIALLDKLALVMDELRKLAPAKR